MRPSHAEGCSGRVGVDLEGALSGRVPDRFTSADALGDRFKQVGDSEGHEFSLDPQMNIVG
jgi:hypothetical protein